MSFKTDLQSNNTDLQAILATINSLPEAGSGGGGGSLETCAVTVVRENYTYGTYVTYENGEIVTNTLSGGSSTVTLENVLCNSSVVLNVMSGGVKITGDAVLLTSDILADYVTYYNVVVCKSGNITLTCKELMG